MTDLGNCIEKIVNKNICTYSDEEKRADLVTGISVLCWNNPEVRAVLRLLCVLRS